MSGEKHKDKRKRNAKDDEESPQSKASKEVSEAEETPLLDEEDPQLSNEKQTMFETMESEKYSFDKQLREDIPLIYGPHCSESSPQFKNYLLSWISKIIESPHKIGDLRESWTNGDHFISLMKKIIPNFEEGEEIIDNDKVKHLKKLLEDLERHTGITPPVLFERDLEAMIVDNIPLKEENVFKFLAEILLFAKSYEKVEGRVIREFTKDSYYTELFETIPLNKVPWKEADNFAIDSEYFSNLESLIDKCSTGDCLEFKKDVEGYKVFYGVYIGNTNGNGLEVIYHNGQNNFIIKKKEVRKMFKEKFHIKIYNVIDAIKPPLRSFKILRRAYRGYKKPEEISEEPFSSYDFAKWCRNAYVLRRCGEHKPPKCIKESAEFHYGVSTEVKNFMDQITLGDWLNHSRWLPYSHMSIYVGPCSEEQSITFEPYIIEKVPDLFSDNNIKSSPLKRAWEESILSRKRIKINNKHDDNTLEPLPATFIRNNALMAYFKETIQGNMNYNLILNNCEHFATACRYGEPSFTQACPLPTFLQTFLEKRQNRGLKVLGAFQQLSNVTQNDDEKKYISDMQILIKEYENKSMELEMNKENIIKRRDEVIDQIEQDIANITRVIDEKWNEPQHINIPQEDMYYLQQKIEEHFRFYRLLDILLNQLP